MFLMSFEEADCRLPQSSCTTIWLFSRSFDDNPFCLLFPSNLHSPYLPPILVIAHSSPGFPSDVCWVMGAAAAAANLVTAIGRQFMVSICSYTALPFRKQKRKEMD